MALLTLLIAAATANDEAQISTEGNNLVLSVAAWRHGLDIDHAASARGWQGGDVGYRVGAEGEFQSVVRREQSIDDLSSAVTYLAQQTERQSFFKCSAAGVEVRDGECKAKVAAKEAGVGTKQADTERNMVAIDVSNCAARCQAGDVLTVAVVSKYHKSPLVPANVYRCKFTYGKDGGGNSFTAFSSLAASAASSGGCTVACTIPGHNSLHMDSPQWSSTVTLFEGAFEVPYVGGIGTGVAVPMTASGPVFGHLDALVLDNKDATNGAVSGEVAYSVTDLDSGPSNITVTAVVATGTLIVGVAAQPSEANPRITVTVPDVGVGTFEGTVTLTATDNHGLTGTKAFAVTFRSVAVGKAQNDPFVGQPTGRRLVSDAEIAYAKAQRHESGMFWVKPDQEPNGVQTFVDLDFEGGGWILAGFGVIENSDSGSKNMHNLNRPNGHQWGVEEVRGRGNRNGVIGLSKGAIHVANQATYMLLAMNTGGKIAPTDAKISDYDFVYMANIADSDPQCTRTFENHGSYNGGCNGHQSGGGQTCCPGKRLLELAKYTVHVLKAPAGYGQGTSFEAWNMCASLGVTWSDSYMTGYGWYTDTTNGQIMKSRPDGPFMYTISGTGHSGEGCNEVTKWQPDFQDNGKDHYNWNGWWTTQDMDHYGSNSIWFK